MGVIEVMKWVFIVFIAGLIGYLGRRLAMLALEKLGDQREKEGSQKHGTASKDRAKLRKKQAKARLKEKKKAE